MNSHVQKFEAQAILIGHLEHAGSELPVDRQGSTNYPACNSIQSVSPKSFGGIDIHAIGLVKVPRQRVTTVVRDASKPFIFSCSFFSLFGLSSPNPRAEDRACRGDQAP